MPIVEAYTGGGEGGGDTPSVTYLYTASGSSNASANGDYYDTGEEKNGRKIYTNGTCYIFYDTVMIAWLISKTKYNSGKLSACFVNQAEVPTSGWDNGVTVTKYAGNSGDDSGSDEGGETSSETVTITSSTSVHPLCGDYVKTFEGTYTLNKSDVNAYISFFEGEWQITHVQGNGLAFTRLGGTEGDINSIAGTKTIMFNNEMMDKFTVTITIKSGSSSSGEEPSGGVSYKVTCDGFTGSFAKYAGTYSQINAPATGTEAAYKNENGCEMRWANGMYGWSFYPNVSSTEPAVVTYETSENPVNATNKSYWFDPINAESMQPGTITLVSGSEGGSEQPSSKHTLVVSGFRMTESMKYYSVSSLNYEYIIDDASKTGYDRTWTSPDNGVTILYRDTWGYWGFANSYNSTGGDIYTYGAGGNPYNADGSSTQWQCGGTEIAGAAIVKDSSEK
jgi:hypothetical protein